MQYGLPPSTQETAGPDCHPTPEHSAETPRWLAHSCMCNRPTAAEPAALNIRRLAAASSRHSRRWPASCSTSCSSQEERSATCARSPFGPCTTPHCSQGCWKRSQRDITGAHGTARSWVRAAHCRMLLTPQLPAIRAASSQAVFWLPSQSTPGLPHACKHTNLRPVILLNRAVSHHVNASCTAHHQH